MSDDPIVLQASDPVSLAARLMERLDRESVIVEDGGRPIGLFTEHDLLACAGGDLDRLALGEVARVSGPG